MQIQPLRRRLAAPMFLLGILVLSAWLNFSNLDFPLGYHFDEPKKVVFIKSGTQDFHHPLLMLELCRAVQACTHPATDQEIVESGRRVMAATGVLVVLMTYLLVRLALHQCGSLLVTLGTAVSPILVIHSHYLKEDVLLTLFCLGALWCFARLIDRPTLWRAAMLGTTLGLAGATHYKAGLLPLVFVVLLWSAAVPSRGRMCLVLGLAFWIAINVFLLVNWRILNEAGTFWAGMVHDGSKIVSGRETRVDAIPFGFSFHLMHSLWPGVTSVILVPSLACMVATGLSWRSRNFIDRLLLVYAVFFYFAAEVSPSKPAPDFARYMLPIVPVLIYFAFKGLDCLSWRHAQRLRIIGAAIAVVMTIVPLYDSLQLNAHLGNDTRAQATAWIVAQGDKACYESHSGTDWQVRSAADTSVAKLQALGFSFLVTSSFEYDQFFLAADQPWQHGDVRKRRDAYVALFERSYVEFRPQYRSFAFSNPVVRVIDLRGP